MATTSQNRHPIVGLGGDHFTLALYIANRPPLPEFQNLSHYRSLLPGEIKRIADETGNHWRKIFNVYAKLAFALDLQGFSNWQALRDKSLLQASSPYALLFSEPTCVEADLHIVMGKTYAQSLSSIYEACCWVDEWFAVDAVNRVIVCPYFDYRQLSNIKIDRLVRLISDLR